MQPTVNARQTTPGVVIELEAGQQVDLKSIDPGGGGITVVLEHKSGRHARLRFIADDHLISRPDRGVLPPKTA